MKKGKLFIISGPSGVGKGSIIQPLVNNKILDLHYSISHTTRKPRANEVDGVNYFFVDETSFVKMIDNHELLEYALFCDNYYGTSVQFVDEMLAKGHNVVLEIEVEGALQVRKLRKDAIAIFITPPSINDLKKRLINRSSEDEEKINKRLKQAEYELSKINEYDYIVCNDDLEKCMHEVQTIIERKIED